MTSNAPMAAPTTTSCLLPQGFLGASDWTNATHHDYAWCQKMRSQSESQKEEGWQVRFWREGEWGAGLHLRLEVASSLAAWAFQQQGPLSPLTSVHLLASPSGSHSSLEKRNVGQESRVTLHWMFSWFWEFSSFYSLFAVSSFDTLKYRAGRYLKM